MSLGFDGDLLYEKLLAEESRTKGRKVLHGAEAMRAFSRGLGRLLREGRKLQGKTSFQNLPISIENKKDSIRKGTDSDGDEWKTKMKVPYGYIPGTKGADGDELDAFVGPEEDAAFAYIVHSNDPETGEFDEDKVMLGFKDKESAKHCFLQHYDDPEFFGGMDEIPMWKFQDKVWVKKETSKRLVASVRRVRESQEYGVKGQKWGVHKADDTEDVRKRGEKTSIGSFSSAQNFVRAAIKEKGLSYVVSEKGMEEVMGRVLGRRGYDSFVGAMSAYLIKDTKGPLERAALKVESGRADDSVSKGLMLLKAITQETLPKDSSVTLYRGVGGDYATTIKKGGSSPISAREKLSSFTSDPRSAKKFAKSSALYSKLGGESADSAVLHTKVPAGMIYASPKTWSTTPGSKEYLVFPRKLTVRIKESVFLEFGVKGMKWGQRKEKSKNFGSHKYPEAPESGKGGKFFHGTNLSSAKRLVVSGLEPGHRGRYSGQSRRGFAYITKSPNAALDYGYGASSRTGWEASSVIVELDVPKGHKLYLDSEEGAHSRMLDKAVPASKIKSITVRRDEKPLGSNRWRKSEETYSLSEFRNKFLYGRKAREVGEALEHGVKGMKWGVRKKGDKKGKVPVGKLRVQTEEYTDALNITLRDQSGVRVGKIEFEALDARAGEEGYQPQVLELNYVQIAPQFRGKGFGKKLYIKGFEKAAKYGAKVVRSDPEGLRAVSADNVWKSLRKMFPNSITSVGSMDAQYFRVDLSRFSGERRKSKESQEFGVKGMKWGQKKDPELENYRRSVISEFEKNEEEINDKAKELDSRVVSVSLGGSVLDEDKFSPDSDIDLKVKLKSGLSDEEQEEVISNLRGKIALGGGFADAHPDTEDQDSDEELVEDPEEEEEEEEEEIAEELGDAPYEDDVDEEPEEDDTKESRRTREGGIYYARSLQSYGTDQEADDLDFLESEFEDEDIIALESCDRKRISGMKYFHKKVEESDAVVISPRRKKKGKYRITAGVWSEARHAMKKGIPVRMLRKGKLHEVKSLKIRKNPKAAGDFADVVLKRRRGG